MSEDQEYLNKIKAHLLKKPGKMDNIQGISEVINKNRVFTTGVLETFAEESIVKKVVRPPHIFWRWIGEE